MARQITVSKRRLNKAGASTHPCLTPMDTLIRDLAVRSHSCKGVVVLGFNDVEYM